MGSQLRMIAGLPPLPALSPLWGKRVPVEKARERVPSPPIGGRGIRERGALAIFVLLLAAALALSACGKKGDLEQREGVKPVYPRTYPTR
jgi:hypothetical protein